MNLNHFKVLNLYIAVFLGVLNISPTCLRNSCRTPRTAVRRSASGFFFYAPGWGMGRNGGCADTTQVRGGGTTPGEGGVSRGTQAKRVQKIPTPGGGVPLHKSLVGLCQLRLWRATPGHCWGTRKSPKVRTTKKCPNIEQLDVKIDVLATQEFLEDSPTEGVYKPT